jgi:glycerol-3-phosphate dehydrogenase
MLDRARVLDHMSTHEFDVLVIGGGITGAGIARDATLRGLRVALIDKGDFASGTSSRSSRLIHGGVRYLEHGYLHLVFEASAERRRLLRLAPDLVQPLAFTWPVYAGERLPMWKLSAGLTLYDVLAAFRNVSRHRRLRVDDVLAAEPAIARDGLRGGVRYYDAATNDARLTVANVVDARELGAAVMNHVTFLGAGSSRDGLRAARVEDVLTGARFEIRARVFVNAAGPWSDLVRTLDGGVTGARVQGSKGAHIALARERVGNRDAITMLHPDDGRVMFVLPAGAHAIVGTTDTFTSVPPDEVRATESDVAYLLRAANHRFPTARLTRTDVVSAWAGIRPLIPTTGEAVAASREHAIQRTETGTISITGGKLTTYRVMAAQVVDAVQRALDVRPTRTATASRPLPSMIPTPDAARAVEHEVACTIGDVLIRRQRVAFETRDHGMSIAPQVADVVGPLLGWSAAQRARELDRYRVEIERMFTTEPD